MPKDLNLLTSAYNSIYFIVEDEGKIGGDAVNALKNELSEMYIKGAPTEWNDLGFNKSDWDWYTRLIATTEYNSDMVSITTSIRMLEVLGHYRNTQVANFQQLKDDIDAEIKKVRKTGTGVEKTESSKITINKSIVKYGNVSVYIPKGIDRSKLMKINKIIDAKFEEEGAQKEMDAYRNYTFPRYKKFAKDKTNIDTFFIDPSLVSKITTEVFPEFEVEEIAGQNNAGQNNAGKPAVIIVGEEQTNFGKKLRIKFDLETSDSRGLYFTLKAVPDIVPKKLSYGGNSDYLLSIKKEDYDVVKPHLEKMLDVTALDDYFKALPVVASTDIKGEEFKNSLTFEDQGNGKTLIRIDWSKFQNYPNEKENIKQIIKYTFPDRDWTTVKYAFIISGDYDQYHTFGTLLKRAGYDTSGFRKLFDNMVNANIIIPRKQVLKTIDDIKTAVNEEFQNSIFDLYDLQYDGIKFLYDKKYAILGSETGGGKTLQLIYAAGLKMNETHSPTIIVTLKSVQKQFEEEIISIMGEDERDNISTNINNIKKWNIFYYDNFSSGTTSESVVERLKNSGAGILILDELHKVKHGTSKRAKNIAEIAKTIPVKWGATATISSNKPLDVQNQLLMLDHPLGKVSTGTFKRDFAGMVPSGYGGAYEESDNFEDRIKAAERLNKWLNLSGVYVRHTKDAMRANKGEEMPDLIISKSIGDFISPKRAEFNKEYAAKMKGFKDKDLAISQLIAYREIVAVYKVDETVKNALDIITKNQNNPQNDYAASKILIFTNFIKSGEDLSVKLQKELSKINPKWKVLTYLSSTSKKKRLAVKSEALNPDVKVLVMSMKMGGTGISFANTFKTMLVNDYDWTPESVEQSEGRIYRINTNHDVKIIYTLDSGLDSELYDKVERKKELAKIIQKYREIFNQEKTEDSEALRKIIAAQKEMQDIDSKMKTDIATKIGAKIEGEELAESFRGYIKISNSDIEDDILTTIKL